MKKIIYGVAVLAIAGFAAFNANVNSNKYGLSEVSLENVQALAGGEAYVERLCMMGPPDFCEYPPFDGYPYWDIIFPGIYY